MAEEGICGIRKDHRGNEIMDRHYKLENANKPGVCARHKDKPLDIFCRDCKATICLSCLIKDHYGHSISEVCEFLDETRKQMTKELEKLSEYEEKINAKKTRLGEYVERLSNQIDTSKMEINVKAEELKQLIEQQRLALVEELCFIKQKQLKEIIKEREVMNNHSAEIASVRNFCSAIILTENPMEISRVMTEFRTTSDILAEDHQVQLERPVPSTKVSFQAEEVQSRKNIIGSITAVTTRLIKRLDVSNICGLTKLENNIYVLRCPCNFLISVYEDQNPFRLQTEIHLTEIKIATDIASSEKLKCLYVTDSVKNCIWKIRVDDHRVTRWLSEIGDPFTLSVTSDDHILNLRDGGHQLEIYGSDAKIIRILTLPTDIQWPLHAVQKPSGQFIIIHIANPGNGGPWAISQLASDGKLISQYCLSNIGQWVNYPWHIYLDLEKDRVFLSSCSEHGVILLDSTSHNNWNKIRLTERETGSCEGFLCCHCSWALLMYYDTSKRQLLIGHASIKGIYYCRIKLNLCMIMLQHGFSLIECSHCLWAKCDKIDYRKLD